MIHWQEKRNERTEWRDIFLRTLFIELFILVEHALTCHAVKQHINTPSFAEGSTLKSKGKEVEH